MKLKGDKYSPFFVLNAYDIVVPLRRKLMYDMHYDLLTFLYVNMKENNQLSNRLKLIHYLEKIYNKNNIIGGFIDLYFMTKEEMHNELDISLQEMNNMKEMFAKSIFYLNEMKRMNIIPKETKFIYSIEGCDYIYNKEELEELYRLGLRSILPVWNQQNQYGSGPRTEGGLTEAGIEFIKDALDLGIVIDVSHANVNTFNGILDVYEQERTSNSIIIASHSNVKRICNNARNLNDEQLLRLKNIGGYIGLVLYSEFISDKEKENKREKFMEHLDYLINNIGFDVNKIVIATDNMEILENEKYKSSSVLPIGQVKEELYKMISYKYGHDIAMKIIKENAENLIMRINYTETFLSE